MTPPLFVLDPLPAADTVSLGGEEGRHAARVRRIGTGEAVQVTDGAGTVLDCTVREVTGDGLLLAVVGRRTVAEPDPRLVVAQALPKGERAELAVELMTELGVDEIVPWSAERAVVQWRDDRAAKSVAKWRRAAREAGKQSRRPRFPVVTDLASTEDVITRTGDCCVLVLHESAELPVVEAPLPERGRIVVVVGPEGGISDTELERFVAAGAHPVRLGEPVLRTSTAGAAALAVLSARIGRWSRPPSR